MRNATISFIVSLCLRMEQLVSHWTGFREMWYLRIFRKSIKRIQVSLKPDKNIGYLTWRPVDIFIVSRSVLLKMRDVSDKSCREDQNTHFVFSIFFKSCLLWHNVEKYCSDGWATDDNMAHAHCMLDTQGYKHSGKNIQYLLLFPATVVVRTRFVVTLYVHCLSGLYNRDGVCVYCAVRTGYLYTVSLTFSNSTFCPHSVFMCFVWIWEQTAIISLYNINWLVFITEKECVYCAVRTGSLYTASLTFSNSTFCSHSVIMCFVWI